MNDKNHEYWNKNARNYDRSMLLLGRPVSRMLKRLKTSVVGEGRVLEIAAGTGLITPILAEAAKAVVATDYAEAMLHKLQERVDSLGLKNVQCELADVCALRFPDGSFDVAVAANVLHLVPDLFGALLAMRRVVKPGGKIIVPTFCHDETLTSQMVSQLLRLTGFPGLRKFTLQSLCAAVANAGIQIVRSEVFRGPIPIGYVEGIA